MMLHCGICDISTDDQQEMMEHMKIHELDEPGENGKSFNCPVCQKSFSHAQSRNRHVKTHTERPKIQCGVCDKVLMRQESLARHMLLHVPEEEKQMFYCDVCEAPFTSYKRLRVHMKIHNIIKDSCDMCDKVFSSISNLERHKIVYHSEALIQDEKLRKRKEKIEEIEKARIAQIFQCPVCEQVFKHSQSRNRHVKTHTDDVKYPCTFCGKVLLRPDSLERHMKYHLSADRFSCDICGKSFNTKIRLTSHTTTQHKGCEFCGKKFSQMRHLQNHMKRHMKNDLFDEKFVLTVDVSAASVSSETAVSSNSRLRSNNEGYPVDFSDKMEEMSDSMDEMSENIDEMSDNTDEMSDRIDEMSDNMEGMLDNMDELSNSIEEKSESIEDKSDNIAELSVNLDDLDKPDISVKLDPDELHDLDSEDDDNKDEEHADEDLDESIEDPLQAFYCEICNAPFKLYKRLLKHMKKVHQGNSTCEECNQEFVSKSNLKRHMQRIHGLMKEEEERGVTINESAEDIKPMKLEKKESKSNLDPPIDKSFPCDQCETILLSREQLKEHWLSLHPDYKPFKCPTCTQCFKHSQSRNRHARTHQVDLKYPCHVCDKKFNRLDSLTKHKNTKHAPPDQKQMYACTLCESSYLFYHSLERHMRTHFQEGRYACTLCNKSFTSETRLATHMTFHTGIICAICNITFSKIGNLNKHMKKHEADGSWVPDVIIKIETDLM